jgi:hypothetical protein
MSKSKAVKTITTAPAASVSAWPSQKKVQELADQLDDVVNDNKEMLAAKERLSKSLSSPDALRRARDAVDWYEGSGVRRLVTSGVLSELEGECSPNSWWDEDGDVQRPVVATMVATLVGSWPTSNIPDPAVFVRALIGDVMALNPSFVMFESASRKLRRELKFMPSISEVLAELESQQSAWDKRSTALKWIEDDYQGLVELIAKSEVAIAAEEERRERQRAEEEERQERQRKYREAKAAPLVVGDRLRHYLFGPGVITKPSEPGWYVMFDTDRKNARHEVWMMADCFEKLVESDDGFTPVAAIEYKPSLPVAPQTRTIPADLVPAAPRKEPD